MTSDKELGNLSGSYALNGLDAADLAEFETHLQQSQATRDEVTELTDTAVQSVQGIRDKAFCKPCNKRPNHKQSVIHA